MTKTNSKLFLTIGSTGFIIVLALNLFGYFGLKQPAAIVFGDSWWPTWSTSYLIWITFLVVGLAQRVTGK